MQRCDLPVCDLRLLDPLFVYPSTIMGREKAIVVNLEHMRCIITADEVLLSNSLDSYVLQSVVELQRRLKVQGPSEIWQSEELDLNRWIGSRDFGDVSRNTSYDYLSFEFKALEIALEAACTFLDTQVTGLMYNQFSISQVLIIDHQNHPEKFCMNEIIMCMSIYTIFYLN